MSSEARFCRYIPASNEEFEVQEGTSIYSVNLREKICTCRELAVGGIPCKHIACCMGYTRGNLEDYCDEWCSVEKYVAAQRHIIHPLYDSNLDPEEGDLVLQPPILRKLPGWPRKNRRREKGEADAGTTRNRSTTVRCKKCNQFGHNSRTCTSVISNFLHTSSFHILNIYYIVTLIYAFYM